MNFLDDILDDDENPKKLLINQLNKSNNFFQLLYETLNEPQLVNDPLFKKNLEDSLKNYILNCNRKQIEILLEKLYKIDNNSKR